MPMGKAGEMRGFASVGHYIQGPGAIHALPRVVETLGKRAIMLIGPHFYDREIAFLKGLFRDSSAEVRFQKFQGNCTESELQGIKQTISQMPGGVQAAIGFGGGKSLDAVRVAAGQLGLPMVLIPTSPATNAATSGLSVVYDEQHMGKTVFLHRNPDYVIADTNYIIQAPARMLAAGIGDALATYFEARNNWQTNNINTVMPGYQPTICGKQVAKACLNTVLVYGERAYLAARHSLRTEEFEDIVEAINLLSGIGWENNGCSIAHDLAAAVSVVGDTEGMMHGECVAFCVLVQLILDKEQPAEFDRIYGFCQRLSLPVRLADLGILDDAQAKVKRIVRQAFADQGCMQVANYAVNQEKVYSAIMLLDALAK